VNGVEDEPQTSLPPAFHASRSPQPESSKANEMTAISGRNLRELFEKADAATSWVRMCRESSRWRVALTGYSLTWKRAATPQGRLLYRLRLSVPRTNGTASGYWPTPSKSDTEGSRTLPPGTTSTGQRPDGKKAQVGLPNAVAMWPTPRHEGFDAGAHRGNPDSLHSAVKLLHTPTAKANQLAPSMLKRDAGSYGHGMLPTPDTSGEKYRLQGNSQQSHSLEAMARRGELGMVPTPTVQDGENTAGPSTFQRNSLPLNAVAANGVPGLKLSAAWVTRLMGYPDGFLDLD